MIPPDIERWIFPALADAREDVPKVELPCDVSLKFYYHQNGDDADVTWDVFRSWNVPLAQLARIAGDNAFDYNHWSQAEQTTEEDYVYENKDRCWPSLVLSPSTYLEHNWVDGAHVLYIVSESTAILTGSRSTAGLALIEQALRGGLATNALVIDEDWTGWERFEIPSAS